MNRLLDLILPRFITEDVALIDTGDGLEIGCRLADVRHGERFAAVATIRSFNLFGFALFPRMVGEPREWPEEDEGESLAIEDLPLIGSGTIWSRPYAAEETPHLPFMPLGVTASFTLQDFNPKALAALARPPSETEAAHARLDAIMHNINNHMNGGNCPAAGSLGECAAIDEVAPGLYEAYLYIWDHEFNDSAAMASWFHAAGAKACTVSLTLYSDYNGDRNGQTEEGSREWVVTFSMHQASSTGSPEGLLTPAQEGGA